jgi:hypothetical protein
MNRDSVVNMSRDPAPSSITTGLLAVFAILGLCVTGWRSMAEPPRQPAGTAFTATAGLATLTTLLQEQTPHIVGSPSQAIVRDRIVAALQAAGYVPSVDRSFQCVIDVGCAEVENIVAIRKGSDPTHAVLVTAHYDSVPAGPGVSDDGSGVAIVLELARERSRLPVARNDIVFLLSDGEEIGLYGARAFAARDPAMKRIAAAVNLEARGAGGPSTMFETGTGNAHLMKLFATRVAYPVSNSLAFEIYKRLPNGTDFTVYRNQGVIGFNFAYVGKASLYHTAYDDLEHIDVATLQHHGDNAFSVVDALASADLAKLPSDHDVSYFDIFGRTLLLWPNSWNGLFGVAALVIILAALLAHRRQLGWRPTGWALLIIAVTPLAMYGLGLALAFPLGHWPGALQLDHPMPWPGRIALLFAAVAIALLLASLAVWRKGAAELIWTSWLGMSVASMAVAVIVPGAAYALLGPCVGFAVVAGASWRWSGGPRWASRTGFCLAAFFWTGHMMMFESALGFASSEFKMLGLVPLVWTLTPVLADVLGQRAARAAIPLTICVASMLAAAAAAAVIPATTSEVPRGENVVYYDDGVGPPRWWLQNLGKPDPEYLAATGVPARAAAFLRLGIFPSTGYFKPATPQALTAPTFTPMADTLINDRRTLTGSIRVGATALRSGLAVAANAGVIALRIEGQPVWSETSPRGNQARWLRIGGVRGRDLRMELVIKANATGPVVLYEIASLPESAEARTLQNARPANAVPFDNGDSAMVVRRIALDPKP